MSFAAHLERNSGRATPSLRRVLNAHHNENANPAGFHLTEARSCSDKPGQLRRPFFQNYVGKVVDRNRCVPCAPKCSIPRNLQARRIAVPRRDRKLLTRRLKRPELRDNDCVKVLIKYCRHGREGYNVRGIVRGIVRGMPRPRFDKRLKRLDFTHAEKSGGAEGDRIHPPIVGAAS
jgi:hypothetical protein